MREEQDRELAHDVNELEFLLRQVAMAVRRAGRQILGRFDITPPQFDALLVLIRSGSLTMGELCSRLYLASSTVTDLVDRMERAGLVVRERDPQDLRVIRVRPTERGHSLLEQVMEARRRYLAGVLGQLDAEERKGLVAALQRLHQLIAQADPQPAP